jgi:hypothetical protein
MRAVFHGAGRWRRRGKGLCRIEPLAEARIADLFVVGLEEVQRFPAFLAEDHKPACS